MASLTINIDDSLLSKNILQKLAKLNDPSFRVQINEYIGNRLNEFVPMSSGALRASMYADESSVSWTAPYAHYQWEGVVYGPNLIGFRSNGSVAWKSGISKYRTNRLLGTPGELELKPQFGRKYAPDVATIPWSFGYTTDGTQSHWEEIYTNIGSDQNSRAFRRSVNSEIARMVKKQLR